MLILKTEEETIKKRVFIGLLAASILLILGIILSGVLIYYNKFGDLYRFILLFILAFLGFFILIVGLGLAVVVMTLWQINVFSGLQRIMNMSIHLLFPVALFLGRLLHIPKDLIKSSYIEVNNKLIMSKKLKVAPEKILILAPHCIQKWDCPYKVTTDVSNCRHCGLCDIDGLSKTADYFGVKLAVVTGGTLARKIVKDLRPHAIIAIACERDLTEGILDTTPLPVMGVLNIRPEGPCKNTKVDLDKVRDAIIFFNSDLGRSQKH